MIISGGENVYPAEVESVLLELPEVAGGRGHRRARPALGRGRPGRRRPRPAPPQDGDALRATLRERLAGFKVPKEVRYVTELPKTATGKIRKPDLRHTYVLAEEDA